MALSSVGPPALLTEQVFASIHAAIMSGELPAGTQLKVRDLAAQVGTSVMPVREALRRLEECGLATREGHKGTVVRELQMTEVVQAYEVRLLLEVEGARRGAPLVDTAAFARLHQLDGSLGRAIADGDLLAALDLEEAVLASVYAASGNTILLESIRVLWGRCRPYKLRGARQWLEEADGGMWVHRTSLLAAVRASDGRAAAEVVRESLVTAIDRIGQTFDSA